MVWGGVCVKLFLPCSALLHTHTHTPIYMYICILYIYVYKYNIHRAINHPLLGEWQIFVRLGAALDKSRTVERGFGQIGHKRLGTHTVLS